MVTVKGASKKSAVLKSLKSKKTYYVRIQTYKTLKNPVTKKTGKVYGKWSTKKAVKIK